jgi:hypothetical protein
MSTSFLASPPSAREIRVLLDIYLAAPTPAAPRGTITGYGRFRKDDDEDVIWCGLDSPDLPELRHKVLLRS